MNARLTTGLLCILGPTASGKTRLAVAAARTLGGEVISADSRQVYRGMDIGTGKDRDDYTAGGAPVRCHLTDILTPGDEFSVFQFRQAFVAAYNDISSRGLLPVLCGGTGLYLDSVLRRYRLAPVPPDERLRDELGQLTDAQLGKRLAAARPLHNTTDTCDRERLVRAIEIAEWEGAHPDDGSGLPQFDAAVFGIRWQRPVLRDRITQRLHARLEQGLIEEVRSLLDGGLAPERLMAYGLEYRFVTMFVTGTLSRNDMFQQLRAAIHDFAKRQETWFRRMERLGVAIEWLDGAMPLEEKLAAITRRCRSPD